MSFIKKGLGKVWKFVKNNWKTIVIVAAVAFTAGIATVGVAGFMTAVSANGIVSAVGSTMWAGVTATAGSMGLGAGASTSAFGGAAAFGGATHVGLGAALGAGGGFGLGAAGHAAMAEAAAANVAGGGALAAGAVPAAGIGVEGTGIGVAAGTAPAVGAEAAAAGTTVTPLMGTGAATGVGTAAEAGIMPGATTGTGAGMMPGATSAAAADEAGMTMAKAMQYGNYATVGGSIFTALGNAKAMNEEMKHRVPLASWGVPVRDAPDDYNYEQHWAPYMHAGADAPDAGGAAQVASAGALQGGRAPVEDVLQQYGGYEGGPEYQDPTTTGGNGMMQPLMTPLDPWEQKRQQMRGMYG